MGRPGYVLKSYSSAESFRCPEKMTGEPILEERGVKRTFNIEEEERASSTEKLTERGGIWQIKDL